MDTEEEFSLVKGTYMGSTEPSMLPYISITTALLNLSIWMRHESECFHTKPDRNGNERVLTQCGFLHCSLVDNPKGLLWKRWRLCQLLWGVFHKSGNYVPAFIIQILFPGAGCAGLAWYEREREVGSGLFSPHTEPGQSKCLRKICCFLLYLISSPVSSIPKSSESSDTF